MKNRARKSKKWACESANYKCERDCGWTIQAKFVKTAETTTTIRITLIGHAARTEVSGPVRFGGVVANETRLLLAVNLQNILNII